jgi:hypothetical protein
MVKHGFNPRHHKVCVLFCGHGFEIEDCVELPCPRLPHPVEMVWKARKASRPSELTAHTNNGAGNEERGMTDDEAPIDMRNQRFFSK